MRSETALDNHVINKANKLCYGIIASTNKLERDSVSYRCRTQFLAFLRLCADTTGLFSKYNCKNINAEEVNYSEIIITLSKAIYGLFFSNLGMHSQLLKPEALVEEKRFLLF
jgi:hypothetical protein